MLFTKKTLEVFWLTLHKKFFECQVTYIYFEFLKIYRALNSQKNCHIHVWIHSRLEWSHTNLEWIHSTYVPKNSILVYSLKSINIDWDLSSVCQSIIWPCTMFITRPVSLWTWPWQGMLSLATPHIANYASWLLSEWIFWVYNENKFWILLNLLFVHD